MPNKGSTEQPTNKRTYRCRLYVRYTHVLPQPQMFLYYIPLPFSVSALNAPRPELTCIFDASTLKLHAVFRHPRNCCPPLSLTPNP